MTSLSQTERILKSFENLCNRHRGDIHSAAIDYEIVEVFSPRYGGKIQTIVPIVLIDFK